MTAEKSQLKLGYEYARLIPETAVRLVAVSDLVSRLAMPRGRPFTSLCWAAKQPEVCVGFCFFPPRSGVSRRNFWAKK